MIEYMRGSGRDFSALKKLWVECFNDTSAGYKTFFKNNRKNLRIYVARDDTQIVSALYHITCTVAGEQAHYLFGASTTAKQRNKGIMQKLVKYSLNDALLLGDKFSLLYPANDSLYGYYSRFGYERKCHRKQTKITRDSLMHIAEYGGFCLSMTVNSMAKLRINGIDNSSVCFDSEYIKYSVAATKHYGGYVVCSGSGYALIEEDKFGECVVSELFAEKDDVFSLLGKVLEASKAKRFVFNYPLNMKVFNEEKVVEDGMINFLSDLKINDVYIGLRNQ